MDVYSFSFCVPRLSLAQTYAEPAKSPALPSASSSEGGAPKSPPAAASSGTASNQKSLTPAPASAPSPTARRHGYSFSTSSAITPRPSTDALGSGKPGFRNTHHLSRPASLASLVEHAANEGSNTVPGSPSTANYRSISPSSAGRSPVVTSDSSSLASRRSHVGLSSEPSSVTSSSSTHRTSASLGSNIAPGTSITSSSSSTGGTSTTAGQSASPPTEDQERLDNLNKKMGRLTSEAMSQHQCMVSFTPIQITVNTRESPVSGKQSPVDSGSKSTNTNTGPASILAPLPKGQGYNVFMSGSYHQVMAARSYLQREMPFDRQCLVVVPTVEVVDSLNKLKPEMSKKLDDIAALTSAQLEVRRHTPATRSGFSMDADRNVDISIKGSHESVEQARVRILVMLDELNGLHTEVFEIDYKYHNMMAGRRRERIQRIQEETSCSIYFPSPFSGIHDGLSDYLAIARASLVFISGDFYNVKRAKDMLAQDVFARETTPLLSREAVILPKKLDWMLSERLDELRQCMHDNATFVQFPLLGSSTSVIIVWGESRTNIDRTLRYINSLACEIHVASVWLLPSNIGVYGGPPVSIPGSRVPQILKRVSAVSGADVSFKSNCFEMCGLEKEVRNAVIKITELQELSQFTPEIRFQLELSTEFREFLSGKKNGKLLKIEKMTGVRIKFENMSDFNVIVNISGGSPGALDGVKMVLDELPSEISFHIPEIYHKRIIGVGGKNIQRIMKLYGVYVKFSSAEELTAFGGYADLHNNVVARTPAKNAHALEQLRQAIVEDVLPRDKDFVSEQVLVPRRYHRVLQGEKAIFLHDIEAKTNSEIRFPPRELGNDMITIYGPESQIHLAAQMLLVHIPFEAEFKLPHSTELTLMVNDSSFLALLDQIRCDHGINVTSTVDLSGGGNDTTMRFALNRSNVDSMAPAREQISDFLTSHKIRIYSSFGTSRADKKIDPFQHFNSAIFTKVAVPGEDQVLLSAGRLRTSNSPELFPSLASQPQWQMPAQENLRHIFEAPTPPFITYGSHQAEGGYFGHQGSNFSEMGQGPYGHLPHQPQWTSPPLPHASATAGNAQSHGFGFQPMFDVDGMSTRVSRLGV